MTIVYDTINSLRRFKDWNPLVLRDPKEARAVRPGLRRRRRLDYVSDKPQRRQRQLGDHRTSGQERHVRDRRRAARPRQVTALHLQAHRSPQRHRNVEITQTYDVNYGWNLMGRYAGLYVSRHVGDDMKLGL